MKSTLAICTLAILAEGFEETEDIALLSLLRQANLCIKVVGLVSGLVGSAHGLWVMPDLTLVDLDPLDPAVSIGAVILPTGRQSLTRLEADPRVHKLLRQVVAQHGHIITGPEGLAVVRAAAISGDAQANVQNAPSIILRRPEEPFEAFAQDLIRRLKQPIRA